MPPRATADRASAARQGAASLRHALAVRAVGVVEFGGPEALRVVELPEPWPGPGEVRISVRCAAVNPTDLAFRSGLPPQRFRGLSPPHVPGMDAAGTISAVGAGVHGWRVGDAVMAIVVPASRSHGGAYAEEVVVPAESVARIPAGASFAEASTLPMNGLTASLAMERLGRSEGQTLAVTGAAGAFGGYVIQLAKVAAARVIADASPMDEDLVRRLGADEVVTRGDHLAERIRALVPEGVDGVADGALLNERVAAAIRSGGVLVTLRGWSGEVGRDIRVHPIQVIREARNTAALDRLRELAEAGALTLRVARVLPVEQAAEAHRLLAAGGVRGRLVLDFSH
ncbi:MAG TPA: NADP-dependent oxidoreductase [Candidatus Binatia bacterium]|nr:NADP-dependent oxidoreductase [Candidatus Binatia bacterium]